MFRLKITVMGIFTEIYSFRLNVWGTNFVQEKMLYGNLSFNFFWEESEIIKKYVCQIECVGLLENIIAF